MIVGSPTILNLVPGGVMKCVHVNQVNKNIEIQFKIMNGAAPYNLPEGVTCTIRGTKGDAFGYAAEAAVTAGSNVITVTLTEQLTAVAGARNIFELVFVGAADDMKVSTENFILAVERQAMGEDTVISDSDLSYAEQVLDQLQSVGAVNAQVQQNKTNLAAEISRAQAAEAAEAAARQAADNTLQSNINAEASTRATQDASLQSQINQLVAPSGSAPSAAEVENARVGADGTVYPTLGDAIRGQVTDVKSAFKELNYFDSHSLTEGYTRIQDGVFSPTSGFYDSNLIRCYPGSVFFVIEEKKMESQSLPQNPFVINFFDENGEWLFGSENYTSTVTEITAETSKYGFGGWMYQFTIPDNANIAFWSRYYTTDIWNRFGLFCFYDTADGNYKFAGETPVSALYRDRLIPMEWIGNLSDTFEDVRAQLSIETRKQVTYPEMKEYDLGYVDSQGAVVEYANAYVSDYIEVVPGCTVTYDLYVIVWMMYGVTWYDAGKNRISGITLQEGSGGRWSRITGSVTLPQTAKYIKINARKADSDSDAMRQNASYAVHKTLKDAVTNTNPWNGKRWYAFGTSITDTSNTLGPDGTPTGKYVPYLADLSGMIVTNYGIAGGTIGNTSTGNILTRIKNTDLSGADLITLEGFVNDFVGNLPLGAIGDTDNSTFAGALYDAITYMQSNSDATIVLITETTGRTYGEGNFVVTRANELGAYQYQFNDMIKTMCEYLGVHCIDAGQKSQINQWNPQYLADWIHHTELGGKQYAETIWDELKNIHCNTDVVLN